LNGEVNIVFLEKEVSLSGPANHRLYLCRNQTTIMRISAVTMMLNKNTWPQHLLD